MTQIRIFDRVRVLIATVGTDTITFGPVFNNSFLTPAEAGALDNDRPYYVLEQGTDFELGIGTVGNSVTELARTTVLKSKIGGVLGVTKLTLTGNAQMRFVDPAEAHLALRQTTITSGASYNMIDSDEHILVNKTIGSATAINLVTAVGRRKPVKIVDIKLDADINPITVTPNGVETILGLASWVIGTPGGSVELWPTDDGTRWYI